jgi:peptidoglycan/xylan/chitin deacetylase (PgdA/CDA1 family)
LCFHGLVTPAAPSRSEVNVPIRQFEDLMRAVRRLAVVVPLAELLEEHRRGRRTGGAVAVTFDDAYASLLPAAGLLDAWGLPVTVFVATGAAESGAAFWWDRVEDLQPAVGAARWREFEDGLGLPEAFRLGQPARFGPLRPLRQWVLSVHRGRCPQAMAAALDALEAEAGVRTAQRSMTAAELRELGRNPRVDFGVHTRSHPVLPLLPDDEFVGEVRGALEDLAAMVPRSLPVLAIPFGLFDARTDRLARDAGMTASLSLAARTVGGVPGTHPVPRFCLTRREPAWKLLLRTTGAAEVLLGHRMEGGRQLPHLPGPST